MKTLICTTLLVIATLLGTSGCGKVNEGTPQSAFSLCWVLDKAEGVTQWTTDIPDGEFPWSKPSSWQKWKKWNEWVY